MCGADVKKMALLLFQSLKTPEEANTLRFPTLDQVVTIWLIISFHTFSKNFSLASSALLPCDQWLEIHYPSKKSMLRDIVRVWSDASEQTVICSISDEIYVWYFIIGLCPRCRVIYPYFGIPGLGSHGFGYCSGLVALLPAVYIPCSFIYYTLSHVMWNWGRSILG